VANILVYVELAGGRPAPASLEALGEARRIASHLGATLYAIVPCATPPRYDTDDAIAVLSRRGADRVILTGGPDPELPALHVTHGAALSAAVDRVPPAMLVLAATPGGRDLAPRAAARLGAAFMAEPSVEYGALGELVLSRPTRGGAWRRRLTPEEAERPIVVTLTPGSYAAATGDEEADVLVVDTPPSPAMIVEELVRIADPGANLERARVVVTAGAGVEPSTYEVLRELAAALGGEIAVTRSAVERGLDGEHREVGIGGRRVAPRLYLAFGASGSAEHLAAVSGDAQIVAVNRDPRAPIFRVAAYGVVADVADAAPTLLAAARRGASRAAGAPP
jgi:electron transfer flavoprotein alpha subunit